MDSKIELNFNVIKQIEEADRKNWDSETYITMAMDVSQIKGYSQWILGKLAHEYCEDKRYGVVTEFAKQARQDPSSMRVYKSVYERFIQADPNFAPDGYMPWGVLLRASESKNPIEIINKLQDSSANTIEEAHRLVKIEQTGKEFPPKPKLKLVFDEESNMWKIILNSDDIPRINWKDVKEQLINYFEQAL